VPVDKSCSKIWHFHNKFLSLQQKDGTMNQEMSRTISNYFKTQPVEKAWVFGSFSRGEERADSDVDIMITLIPGTRMGLKFFAMNLELEKLLHRPVDLVIEGDLLPFAEKTANRDKVLVYARA
jgi:hypothetical protein